MAGRNDMILHAAIFILAAAIAIIIMTKVVMPRGPVVTSSVSLGLGVLAAISVYFKSNVTPSIRLGTVAAAVVIIVTSAVQLYYARRSRTGFVNLLQTGGGYQPTVFGPSTTMGQEFGSPANSVLTAFKPGFLPLNEQRFWFEGMGPNQQVENEYWSRIMAPRSEGGCGGESSDRRCAQRAYIQTMKGGMQDRGDLICAGKDGDDYWECLDGVYSNYHQMDRDTGIGSCVCPSPLEPGSTTAGVWTRDSGGRSYCFCAPDRPLENRGPLDSAGNVVTIGGGSGVTWADLEEAGLA